MGEVLSPLTVDGWQVMGDSFLYFEGVVLPAQAGLILTDGVSGMEENNSGYLETIKEGFSTKEKRDRQIMGG